MQISAPHTFHIPVMGLCYTIDTPVKVARFGISSVVSIIEDNLVEQIREYYCRQYGEEYIPIDKGDHDHRARRITEYLNLLQRIVKEQTKRLKAEAFERGNDIVKYFEMLDDTLPLKEIYRRMTSAPEGDEKMIMQEELRNSIVSGDIDVNIMTKCDRTNYSDTGEPLPPEYSDALAALRGFAQSDLASSVVFSAGLNPRLYSYCESFSGFYPDENNKLQKKITIKVSDYRSALIQGKFFAKKGLWISEFRIESGLNCGGHAFPPEGLLLGPILEKFRQNRSDLAAELYKMCNTALAAKGIQQFSAMPHLKITVQGGIGTANENLFLLEHYGMDGTGWGSPFLLVPEVTNVDDSTLYALANAKQEDYYTSYSSPLGVAFNNFRNTSSDKQRKERIHLKRPGSPCYKKFLSFNTEFTERPICTASRQYQHLKIKQMEQQLPPEKLQAEIDKVIEKDCLCEGLGASALLKYNILQPKQLKAVAICPGPNLAYFSGTFTLSEMIDHIYGRANILNKVERPNMMINELRMYVDYLEAETHKETTSSREKYLREFSNNLLSGICYYRELIPRMDSETECYRARMLKLLDSMEHAIKEIAVPAVVK